MKRVLIAIVVCFGVLVIIFKLIGGWFDRQFWLSAVPGLMENLAILAVAILVVDNMLNKQRLVKLKQTNARRSQAILLLSNILAYKLLHSLELATEKEVSKDPELSFTFAKDRFKTINLSKVFYAKMIEAKDREVFTESFGKTLAGGIEGISKALDDIYPQPDATMQQLVSRMSFSSGTLLAFKMMFKAIKTANAQVGPDDQVTQEQADLLIKVAYASVGAELQTLQRDLIELSEKAKANKLFVCLD